MSNNLISIIIPTKNSAEFLEDCLKSIREQSYKNFEILVIDGNSFDDTLNISKKYKAKIYQFKPKGKGISFDAPYKRNYGVNKSKGNMVYYIDADMKLTKNVLREAVGMINSGYDALIVPEDSFGIGVWAKAKNLERRCYWGDDNVEAPRFFKKTVWKAVGGLDENLGGGGDDWDLYQKILKNEYKVGRLKSLVLHNEGELRISKLIRKRFMYGKDSIRYLSKRPKSGLKSYFPIRKGYIKNWRLFILRPVDTLFFIIMRTVEYGAGLSGIIYTILKK